MQKFCFVLVFMSVIFMVPLIVGRVWEGIDLSLVLLHVHAECEWHQDDLWSSWLLCLSLCLSLPLDKLDKSEGLRPPMVMPMVIRLSPIITMGSMSASTTILCFRGWVWVGCFISTQAWWPISAIQGWRIIWAIRVITLPFYITSSCIHTTITAIMIVIMVIIFMPPIIWTARSRGGILVMIPWITRPGIPTISCLLIMARDITIPLCMEATGTHCVTPRNFSSVGNQSAKAYYIW